jgi:uncharacterized protein YgbK (DUF1537 family)
VIVVVADDLTGACDSAVQFVAAGRMQVHLWPCQISADAACVAISTESRAGSVGTAYKRSFAAVSLLKEAGVDVLFRKIDSQLRGNVAADISGAMSAWGGACVVAPAVPDERRITEGGCQRWNGRSVDVVALLREGGLDAVSAAPAAACEGMVVVSDAAGNEDLAAIAEEVAHARSRVLPAGAAGLAREVAHALGIAAPPTSGWPACTKPLAIVGSPAAMDQAQMAAARGKDVLLLGPEELPATAGHDGLLVTGGETAARVLRWLGADFLELCGEAFPRVPVGVCRGGPSDGLVFALKSGGFGPPDAIDRALEALLRGA